MRVSSLHFMIIIAVIFLIPASPHSSSAGQKNICLGKGRAILVAPDAKKLFLCRKNNIEGEFHIAIGSRGAGKKIEGDRKTPLGTYLLGDPRPSDDFHIFIPIGYPTHLQKENGFTGGEIGIHGPKYYLAWLGQETTQLNWTQGCIATGTKEEIELIAQWKHNNAINTIHIFNMKDFQSPKAPFLKVVHDPHSYTHRTTVELEMEMKTLNLERAARLREIIRARKKETRGGVI